MILRPKNWDLFQHYKDRSPPWIKLHRDILNNRDFMRLPVESKALAPLLWLLASESKDGTFDASLDELAFRLHTNASVLLAGLKPLISKGFFVLASGVLADGLQGAIPETETETEREAETDVLKPSRKQPGKALANPVGFDDFWEVYPRKDAKGRAVSAWRRTKPDSALQAVILKATKFMASTQDWKKEGGRFVPYASTFLNERRWEDVKTGGATVAQIFMPDNGQEDFWTAAGFSSVWEADTNSCYRHNAHEFREGKRVSARSAA